jgi:hypothetical protein
MDKLKKVFRPGGNKDDEVMYGTGSPMDAGGQGGSHEHELPDKLVTDPEANKHEHGVLRQIL